MRRVVVDGIELVLSQPDTTEVAWVGQQEVLEQVRACWLVVDAKDLPLCPRVLGKPGVGKTTLAMAAARTAGRPVYVYQCTMDTRPEDLLVTPVVGDSGKIRYHASPVVTAMIDGATCILDEGNRMSEKSWASLAPLLDHRRYVESVIAGIKISAHRDFRCCVTMNDDASTYELPDYITSRLQPMIEVTFPPREEELEILRYNVPFAGPEILERTVEFLQKAHELDLDISTRDGIHIIRYALKRRHADPESREDGLWDQAIGQVVGPEAQDLDALAEKRRRARGEERPKMGLEDLFLGEFGDWNDDDDQDAPF